MWHTDNRLMIIIGAEICAKARTIFPIIKEEFGKLQELLKGESYYKYQ
jgi:hypothetical protein